MSEIVLRPAPPLVEPLHVAVRRLRWFRAAFRASLVQPLLELVKLSPIRRIPASEYFGVDAQIREVFR